MQRVHRSTEKGKHGGEDSRRMRAIILIVNVHFFLLASSPLLQLLSEQTAKDGFPALTPVSKASLSGVPSPPPVPLQSVCQSPHCGCGEGHETRRSGRGWETAAADQGSVSSCSWASGGRGSPGREDQSCHLSQ